MKNRKHKESLPESLRWPILFKDPEKAESLFSGPGWAELLADLRAKHAELSENIVHNVPYTAEQIATQNFDRGQCSIAEDLLGLEEEFKHWKEQL